MNDNDSSSVERWEIVQNYTDYEVSSFGRIQTVKRFGFSRIVASKTDKVSRYVKVDLYLADSIQQAKVLVHILVAVAFCLNENPNMYTRIKHLDGDLGNNRWDNLQWIPVSASNDVTRNGSRLTDYQVREIRRRAATGESYKSMCVLFGVRHSVILGVVSRRTYKGIK